MSLDVRLYRQRPRRPVLTAALAVGFGISTAVNAQMVVSEIGPSLPAHILNQVNTLTQRMQDYSQYYQEGLRWKATWDHYYQQIARFISKVRNPTLSNKVSFEPVPMDFGVAEKCGGSGGINFSLTSVAQMLAPNMEGDVVQAQRRVCTQIQVLHNQKHNLVVNYFKEVAPVIKQDLEAIDQQRRSNNEQGTLQAIAEASQRLANQQGISETELETQLKNCDTAIAMLTRMQQTLAHRALNGKPDPVIGTLVKTATLEAALKVK